jgi:surface protein
MFRDATSFNTDLSKWDVSSVTNMYAMFLGAPLFSSDLSKWDVSSVQDMDGMFCRATAFNGDISKWDVSSVEDMHGMFNAATSFTGDISKWDVSSVKDMDGMFNGATAFTQKLCTAAWVHSKAIKRLMFEGTSGSISPTVCTISTTPPVFSPQSRTELKGAVNAYLEFPAKRDEQMPGSEATSPAAGSDHGTFVCKPAVCLDKSCNPIG